MRASKTGESGNIRAYSLPYDGAGCKWPRPFMIWVSFTTGAVEKWTHVLLTRAWLFTLLVIAIVIASDSKSE